MLQYGDLGHSDHVLDVPTILPELTRCSHDPNHSVAAPRNQTHFGLVPIFLFSNSLVVKMSVLFSESLFPILCESHSRKTEVGPSWVPYS